MSSVADGGAGLSPDQTPAGWSDYADSYDEWLAPVTRRYADDVVRLLEIGPGVRLIDVAAGTGALSIAAARAGARVLATDFAPGMVALLQREVESAGLDAEVRRMDGQSLTVPDGTFDAAVSLFGLIFFPDVAAGAAELRRVLRFGGRAAVVAWAPGGLSFQPLALEALASVGIPEPDRATLPAAFRLSDPARLEALLIDAGFSDVVVQQLEHAWPVDDPEALFRSIPSWSAPMRPAFDRLDPAAVRDAAVVFRELVRDRFGADGLPTRALLAVGTR
jgi:SAM-dependent methyltransferase